MCGVTIIANSMNHYNIEGIYQNIVKYWQVTLIEAELWQTFHSNQTEMIITKPGRKMFPELNLRIAGLDPQTRYEVRLEMHLKSSCRYKYNSSVGWSPAGKEEIQSDKRVYVHPDSPAIGERWMAGTVEFKKVKITNSTLQSPPHILELSSMHMYQPRIVITQISPSRFPGFVTKSFDFPETEFIAVTAYQNEKITQLKIDHNRFAKGFRENGKSNKRKRTALEEESSQKRCSMSPARCSPPIAPKSPSTPQILNYSLQPIPTRPFPMIPPALPYQNNYSYFYKYAYCPPYFSSYFSLIPYEQAKDLSISTNITNRKFTDFSIKSLMS